MNFEVTESQRLISAMVSRFNRPTWLRRLKPRARWSCRYRASAGIIISESAKAGLMTGGWDQGSRPGRAEPERLWLYPRSSG
jgi:hypothetical protein